MLKEETIMPVNENQFDERFFDHQQNKKKRRNQQPGEDEEPLPPPVERIHADKNAVGRNDPCPCGSGRKYKKCCGK
jgi:uncharacterized protein YecA (UPF0149 family)